MAAKSFSLADFNIVKKCEGAVEFEPIDEFGKGLGIKLSVLGSHAPAVQKWINKELNNRRHAEAMQAKRGKSADVRPIEEDIEFGIEVVAIRIVGWSGLTEECTPENALLLCQTNPDICAQVREFSEKTTNFTRG
jgi:hypothetical protein